ncbi:Diaminopimelate epimerase [Dissostichus eleginoides]|uniref:Diaminopimelate epimerase n=1 Tax=Dissostichus eleginoides TaxID=100907 RepID=A0AAD9CFH2_DISEL|nr:Diaminopimelate epimerase [Dissostichus eleginoides]
MLLLYADYKEGALYEKNIYFGPQCFRAVALSRPAGDEVCGSGSRGGLISAMRGKKELLVSGCFQLSLCSVQCLVSFSVLYTSVSTSPLYQQAWVITKIGYIYFVLSTQVTSK